MNIHAHHCTFYIVNPPSPPAQREADWTDILKYLERSARRALRWGWVWKLCGF